MLKHTQFYSRINNQKVQLTQFYRKVGGQVHKLDSFYSGPANDVQRNALPSAQPVYMPAFANILFVADRSSGMGIANVLTSDGHTVTTHENAYSGNTTPILEGNLSGYDGILWISTDTEHNSAALFQNLTQYVNDGGWLFITGYDSIVHPNDPLLIEFLGGTGSTDTSTVGRITRTCELTTGLFDIRGRIPTGGFGDQDTLVFPANTSTLSVSGTPTNASWVIKPMGSGLIAYVSNGQNSPGTDPSWTRPPTGNEGVYNATVRNFFYRIHNPPLS